MPCYKPVLAWKPADGGPLVFSEKKDCREISISCGQCIGCRIIKRDAWAVRLMCEAQMHDSNCFITLTYDDEHFPKDGSLDYRDVQLFLKRLRKHGKFRFFCTGEYGEQLERPHWHILLFGFDFADKRKCNSLRSSFDLFESELLKECWPFGFHSIGAVSFESARYCAAYVVKKRSGDDDWYKRVDPFTGEITDLAPEMAHMSLKPGIGFSWLEKYWRDLYITGHDCVFVGDKRKKIPKFFDAKMDVIAPLIMDSVEFERFKKRRVEDNTRARLEVREKVAIAKERFNKERFG